MSRSSLGWIALLAASAMVAYLGWQNRGLRRDRDWLVDRVSYAYPGMYVPALEKRDLKGKTITLGAPMNEAQVLFFFDHTCPYCLKSAPTIAQAARQLRVEFGDRVAMIGVCHCSETEAADYARRHRFDFPIVPMRERREVMLYRARIVPVLLAIGRDGRVRHAVQGVFDTKEQVSDLLAELNRVESSAESGDDAQAVVVR